MKDSIEIRRLATPCHIGVPDEERATPQIVWVTVKLEPLGGFDGLQDRISATVDYFQVAQEIKALAAERPRQLIETLAMDIASHALLRHPVGAVTVRVEKEILPDAECVAVELRRSR